MVFRDFRLSFCAACGAIAAWDLKSAMTWHDFATSFLFRSESRFGILRTPAEADTPCKQIKAALNSNSTPSHSIWGAAVVVILFGMHMLTG